MKILVIAEHDNHILKPATLAAVTAARTLGHQVQVLVAGSGCAAVAEQAAAVCGVEKVLVAEAGHFADGLAENLALQVYTLADGFTHILAAATAFGKNVLPRVAALLDIQPISEVVAIKSADTFVRPIYAGNALSVVQSRDRIKLLTVRPSSFAPAGSAEIPAAMELVSLAENTALARLVRRQQTTSARPELTSAKVVISGGRGMGSAEGFALLEPIADKLSAAIGASRAAVDAGFAPNEIQVGQTGKVVAPDLYIAVGISGAIQHLAGMKDAKVIVAINKDPDAPIFSVADYGVVADLFTALPELASQLH